MRGSATFGLLAVILAVSVCAGANPSHGMSLKRLVVPDWVQRPTLVDLNRYYPEKAREEGVSGNATLDCHVLSTGKLEACTVASEDPDQYGFGKSALKLSRYFQVRPATATEVDDPTRESAPSEGGEVQIPIHFGPPQPLSAATPASALRLLDPKRVRLTCPVRAAISQREARAQVSAATASVEAQQADRLRAFDMAWGDSPGKAADRTFSDLQRRYQRERFSALYPLAAQGNPAAVSAVAVLYRSGDSGFADFKEWLNLLGCASDLGDPAATVSLMQWYWHEKGDGSFAAVQRSRSKALDLAGKAADQGDPGGLFALGVYIGAGFHQYPVTPEIGRKLFVLCAQTGDDFCKWRLVEAAEQSRAYALEDPLDTYLLTRDQAKAQPALYAHRRDALRARLSPQDLKNAESKTDPWVSRSWASMTPEWLAVRGEILEHGCPPSVSCVLGVVCTCAPH